MRRAVTHPQGQAGADRQDNGEDTQRTGQHAVPSVTRGAWQRERILQEVPRRPEGSGAGNGRHAKGNFGGVKDGI